jgi:2',3'-cyclic-nucleotide 2'-phosphodiesterase (5'-nucleotidase family)
VNIKPHFVVIISILFFLGCREGYQVEHKEHQRITISDSIPDDQNMEDIISPYRDKIKGEMDKPLAYNANPMFKNDTPYNTAIGNMMADAVFELANPVFYSRFEDSIDVVLLNHGGIRAGMSQGTVTTRTAYSIMPFENFVVIAELDASAMQEMFNYLSRGRAHPFSNLNIVLDKDGKLMEAKVNQQELDDNKTYFVATTDYLINGGDSMQFFQKAKKIYEIDYKLRNLLIDYFTEQDTINYTSDNRFIKL